MLGGHIDPNKSIQKIIQQTINDNNENNPEEIWGVHLDELSALIDEEDVFDVAPDDGPDPPIAERLTCPVVFDTVSLGDCDIDICQAAYNQIRPGYTVVLYGPRRSGKTRLLKNICQRIRPWFPDVIVFTKTKDSGEYFQFIPITHVIDGLDEELLLKVIICQMKKKQAETRGEDMGNYNLLIILDDCMSEKLRYKDIFNKIFYNGRHYNITLLVTLQDVKGIAPSATINADLAMCFALPDKRGRDTIREKFVDYLDKNQFGHLMDSGLCNKKYHIIVFDIAHRYNPIDRRISLGCVDETQETPFVMGDYHMWINCKKQLYELGFGNLLKQTDWGIIKPTKKKKQNVNLK